MSRPLKVAQSLFRISFLCFFFHSKGCVGVGRYGFPLRVCDGGNTLSVCLHFQPPFCFGDVVQRRFSILPLIEGAVPKVELVKRFYLFSQRGGHFLSFGVYIDKREDFLNLYL